MTKHIIGGVNALMRKHGNIGLLIFSFFIFQFSIFSSSCSRDDNFQNPSFLCIKGFKVVPPSTNATTVDSGFYTNDITSCIVFAHFAGRTTVDTIGHFELPFSAPVLYSGVIDSLEIYPAVRISGVSGMQPWYDFYQPAVVRNITLTPGDTLIIDTLLTTTYSSATVVHHWDLFEPQYTDISFDSVTWHKHAPEEACSGEGYISVFVPDTVSNRPFSINHVFNVTPARSTLYLELDTRSDMLYEVYMHSSYTTGGSTDQQPIMRIYPTDHWQHLYILLGRTWSWFNYNPTFTLSFAALNTEGVEGTIRIDNVKIISHP